MDDLMDLLAAPVNDEFYNAIIKENLDKRILIFNSAVKDSNIEDYIMYILKWNAEDRDLPVEKRKKIWIVLNSPGGDKLIGMALLDVIKHSKTPIYCFIVSLAASMASYIPMVSRKTYAFAHSVVCIHDGEVGVVQTTRKANDTMNFIKKCDERLDALVIENTNITGEFLDKIADREYYMFADEAKELGIIDCIIGTDCSIDNVLN